MTALCPICQQPIIQPSGNPASKILVISSQPTEDDLKFGISFKGEYGVILRTEFAKYGMDLFQMRMTCLWLHKIIAKSQDKDSKHFQWHFEQVIHECLNKKAILMLGTDVTHVFLNKHSSTELSGLIMKSDMLSADIVMGTRNPLDLLSGTHGEFTLAIQKFANAIQKEGLY